ncbi:MAG: prolipoprotein diacylglyceryl transferase family protein, partial [Pseudomonadota bacterium]
MIPYLTPPNWPWLPFNFFTMLILLGTLAAFYVAVRQGRRHGLPRGDVIEMGLWTAIPGYLGSHTLLVVFYHPERILSDPWSLIRFHEGISAFGGLVSAVIAFAIYIRLNGLQSEWRMRGDILMQGFIIAWIFGRTGCSFVHDHPGVL